MQPLIQSQYPKPQFSGLFSRLRLAKVESGWKLVKLLGIPPL